MAAVISISSDEESLDDTLRLQQPPKKLKLEAVICLDDDDEKNTENNVENNMNHVIKVTLHKSSINKCKSKEQKVLNKQNDTKDDEKERTAQTSNDVLVKKVQNIETVLNIRSSMDETENEVEERKISSQTSSLQAISTFNDIYQHLKNKLRIQTDIGNSSENSSKHEVIIAKLEHTFRKVQKVIKKLEEAEVDFDDEEDSNYLKMQRYRERAVKIYEKICKYRKEDANANNILYNRLDFSGSTYPEFNHAINKRYKNNTTFPTYYDLERILKKVMEDKNMNLSETTFRNEARECFKNLGNLLQKRRKLDLLNIHSSYLMANDDPALENEALQSKLRESSKEASSKIDEICLKYVKLQELGENPTLSPDSDDSKRESSEDESDNEENQ
ncbi:hypothetical protein Trydic_g13002 [Trypoxylus dichotomus]